MKQINRKKDKHSKQVFLHKLNLNEILPLQGRNSNVSSQYVFQKSFAVS